jgi:UDP-N-acetylmuramyl pentapeptide synthase
MPERLTLADIYMVLANALVDLPPANLPQADSVPLELWAVQVSRVVIDSRQAMPDSVFVALRGEQTDGHQYVCDALKRGARCAIVDKEPRDWLSALWRTRELGRHWRRRSNRQRHLEGALGTGSAYIRLSSWS